MAVAIRADCGILYWGAQKDVPSRKRRRDGGLVHRRSGPEAFHDAPYVAVWGHEWQGKLRETRDTTVWKSMRDDFVYELCNAWQLPRPSRTSTGGSVIANDVHRTVYNANHFFDLPPP